MDQDRHCCHYIKSCFENFFGELVQASCLRRGDYSNKIPKLRKHGIMKRKGKKKDHLNGGPKTDYEKTK